MRELPLHTPYSRTDRVFFWLQAHPRATGIIIAALILFVSSLGDARYGG